MKTLKCSRCPMYKKGTDHVLHTTDSIGKWYKCTKCNKTMSWSMTNND